jgi:hypothetical protein
MRNGQNQSSLKPIIINGLFLLVGGFIGGAFGYFSALASADAQIRSAQESAKAQITAAAISIFGPISTTQTAEARITPSVSVTSANATDILLLESIPQEMFSFQGSDEKRAGKANLRILYASNQQPLYKFIYDLPTSVDTYGWVGLAFRFDEGINVSEYKFLDFTIRFDAAGQSIDLYLVDRADIKKSTSIVSPGKDVTNVSFPLTNFTEVDLNALKEINFYTDTDANTGYHTLFISNIRFVK